MNNKNLSSRIDILDEPSVAEWQALVKNNPKPETLQLKEFADVKMRSGWRAKYVVFKLKSGEKLATLYLTRRVPVLGEFWYCPNGPGANSLGDFAEVCDLQKELADEYGVFAIKMEPTLQKQSIAQKHLSKVKEIKSKYDLRSCVEVQRNQNTIVIDLEPEEDDVMAGFRQKARRYIRKAEKLGVSVEATDNTESDFEIMFDLYTQTAERAGFHLRSKDYYFNFWKTYADNKSGQLFFAKDAEGKVVAGVFVTYLGPSALYKDGGSVREGLPDGTSYFLQWEVMRWLKTNGVLEYDLHGSPPQKSLEDKTHRSYSLGVFKSSFNNIVTEKIGAHEQVFSNSKFLIWQKIGLRVVQSWSVRRTKDKGFY